MPFCYYSLLGRVIDFPSRVRVVKKIPSTGRVASTRHSLVMEGPVEGQVEEDMGDLAAEGTGDQAARVGGRAAAEEGEEGMEAPNGGRERMWSFLGRGLAEGLAESHPGVIGKMTVRGDRAGWRIAEAAGSPVLEQASQAGGVQVEVQAILCLAAAVVTEGQAPVEDTEAPMEMAMEPQVAEGQEDFQVAEETEDMELPAEDLAVKCRCSSVQLSTSKSVRMFHGSSVKQ